MTRSAIITVGDLKLHVVYTYEKEEKPEYEFPGNCVYPGAPEGVTIENIYAYDPKIRDLRVALAGLLARPNEARAIDRAAVVLEETRNHVGPELGDFADDALDEIAEKCLASYHDDEADAKAAHDDYQYEMLRDAARKP